MGSVGPKHPQQPLGGHWLTGLSQDLRFAARIFSRRRGFTATAIATLALGIGASAATFSVVYGVLLKPLPFPESNRLVNLLHRGSRANLSGVWNHGPATYFVAYDNQRVFEDIGAWETNDVSVTGRGDPERLQSLAVTQAVLPLLRVQPVLGRLFVEEDDRPGMPLRTVLTYGYWQRKFGGARDVIGQRLDIDGAPVEVIGVLPASFRFLRTEPALLLPMQLNRADADHIEFDFLAFGRLKPGVSIAQANDDMTRWLPRLPKMFERLALTPYIQPLADSVVGGIGRVLWILLAAGGVVLLIACGNVANLFLVRAEARQQEFAMRSALGASRGRLTRALLSESVFLALGGGLLGLLLAQAAIRLLQGIAPADLPRIDEIAIDPTVMLFTFGIAVLSGLLFGAVAVVRFAAPGMSSLQGAGRSASAAPSRHRARNALVVSQIALALMLLIVSGLMIRTFVAMRQVQPGFARAEEVQTFRIAISERLISGADQVARTHQALAERLAQVPGVMSVGLATSITMDGEDNMNYIQVENDPDQGTRPLRRFKSFAPGYFATMGNGFVAGRDVTWDEIYQRAPVVVISQALAREYWTDPRMALGKRIWSGDTGDPWREIVGVVGNERDDGLNQPATPIVYWPILNESYRWRTMAYAVRSSRVGTVGFLRELQQAVWSVNPNLPLASVERLDEIRARSMAQTSFAMAMLAVAAAVALVLGVVGIYSVIAYVATQRTREVGIRIALGAQVGQVRAMFLKRGLWLTGAGIVVGVGAALLLTRVMSALLFGVASMDPMTYVAVSAGLAVVALLATYLPARRASRVDPMIALRADI
jgi:putative ABC transport system permease protein